MKLVLSDKGYETLFLEMTNEFWNAGEPSFLSDKEFIQNDFERYVKRLKSESEGVRDLYGKLIFRQHHYWLLENQKIIGVSSLVIHASPQFIDRYGHISYRIRPSFRRKGYGLRLFEKTVNQARNNHVYDIRVNVDANNQPSKGLLFKAGGQLIQDQDMLIFQF